jgi:nicotinamide mononucleotide transporter
VSTLEWVAALAGAVSVYLSARENIWSWPTAIVNVGLYTIVFRRTGLYSDMGLQVVYLVLSIYGWYKWLYGGAERTQLRVSRATAREWLMAAEVSLSVEQQRHELIWVKSFSTVLRYLSCQGHPS